jgi:ribonuclease P protein component
MSADRNTFTKAERLSSKKALEQLFEKGMSLSVNPVQIIWRLTEREYPFPAQMAVAVPKKNFKLAVTRNLLKRRIREAYRKNKNLIYDKLEGRGIRADLIIIYKGLEIYDYQTIEKAVSDSLKKLANKVTSERNS